jgi:predicted permease
MRLVRFVGIWVFGAWVVFACAAFRKQLLALALVLTVLTMTWNIGDSPGPLTSQEFGHRGTD